MSVWQENLFTFPSRRDISENTTKIGQLDRDSFQHPIACLKDDMLLSPSSATINSHLHEGQVISHWPLQTLNKFGQRGDALVGLCDHGFYGAYLLPCLICQGLQADLLFCLQHFVEPIKLCLDAFCSLLGLVLEMNAFRICKGIQFWFDSWFHGHLTINVVAISKYCVHPDGWMGVANSVWYEL